MVRKFDNSKGHRLCVSCVNLATKNSHGADRQLALCFLEGGAAPGTILTAIDILNPGMKIMEYLVKLVLYSFILCIMAIFAIVLLREPKSN